MHLINPNLFVVSGGPGAGKTTVLEELASRGYPFAPEVARQIIQEQLQSSGTALPWGDREAYTLLMLKRSVESYLAHTPASRPTFSDRGIPDTLCYARLIGLANQNSILDACQRFRYAPVVFLAPPWKEIYETDCERKQDFAEAETTFEQMVQVYRECGYTISELPKASPPARAILFLSRLTCHITPYGDIGQVLVTTVGHAQHQDREVGLSQGKMRRTGLFSCRYALLICSSSSQTGLQPAWNVVPKTQFHPFRHAEVAWP